MVYNLQQTISDFTNNEFLELVESWANKITPDHIHISIPRIELELGILNDDNLRNQLIESTRDALSSFIIENGDYHIGNPSIGDFDNRLENFQFTLDTGIHITRLTPRINPAMLVELCELLRINRRQTIIMLSSEKSERLHVAKLLNGSNKNSVDSAILLLSPLYGSKVLFLISRIIQFLNSLGLSYRKIEELNKKIYRISFSYLVQSAFVGFSDQEWLTLMVELLDESDDVEVKSDGLDHYLGMHVDLQIKNSVKRVQKESVNNLTEKEEEIYYDQTRVSQLTGIIDQCLSFSGGRLNSHQSHENLIDKLNTLSTLDYRIYSDKLKRLFDYLNFHFKSGTVFKIGFIEETLKLFYDNDYYVLDHDMSILDAVLIAKFDKSQSFILKEQVLKFIASNKGSECSVGHVIKNLIHFVSKKFTIKLLNIYEYLQEVTHRLEDRSFYLLENKIWMPIVKSYLTKSFTADLTYQHSQNHLNRSKDADHSTIHNLSKNFTIDDSKISLIWNVRTLLQKRMFNSKDEFRLYQYFELRPDLVCKEVYQHVKDSSFYDYCQFDSAGLWTALQGHLFERSGHQLSSFLQELHVLSISDLHLEFMFPFICRKLFILSYENPELSPDEVLAKIIHFVQENEVIPFERKFAEVTKLLATPENISENERIIRAKTYLARQTDSLNKTDLEKFWLNFGNGNTKKSDFVNVIRNIRRFNPEELFSFSRDIQMKVALIAIGEPVCVNDVRSYIESKIKKYGSYFEGKLDTFSKELFWEAMVYSPDLAREASFQKRISSLLDGFLAGSIKISYNKTGIRCEGSVNDSDRNIIASRSAQTIQEGKSEVKAANIQVLINSISYEPYPLKDNSEDIEVIDYSELLNLIKQKNTHKLETLCNAVTLEDIAFLIESANISCQHDFCADIRKLKAFLRKLSTHCSINETSFANLILKELDANDIITSWKQSIMKAEKRLYDEIRKLAFSNSNESEERFDNSNSFYSTIESTFDLKPEVSSDLFLQRDETSNNFNEVVKNIGVSGIIKLIEYVLDVGRLPLWIENDFTKSPSIFITYIFKKHPEWIRHIFRNKHLVRTKGGRLVSYINTEDLIHFFTHSDFISKEEGVEYHTVYNQLLYDKVSVPYSLGLLLVNYWVQSGCEIIEKDKFYRRLILGCYRDSFCGADIFKENLTKYIQSYPSDFHATFIRLFPPGQNIILPERHIIPNIKKKRFDEVITNGISINNGGIVLINNYMKELFNRLGLLKDDQFVSNLHQQKGIIALHYFVSGTDTIIMQNDILINKILCGFLVDEYLDFECNLDDNDKSIIDGLISAMISQWNAIKTSTIDGFRGNWLIREGILSKQQDKLSLSIEKKVYDILLNQSPFSFSVIRFPWMSETLYVNWPTS
ncbi:MAG: hypothetical protein IPN54_02645 [Bacteroidetes bacterium]|nr:hypothetical protein [Bacteroidota bacterium]